MEECEVPIEAVEDKGSDDDSDSDLDPDGYAPKHVSAEMRHHNAITGFCPENWI